MFFHFMNKLLHPLVQLKTEDDIYQFFNTDEEYIEQTKFIGEEGPALALGELY